MSDIIWPADLPPLVDVTSFKRTLPETRVRTQMDAGPKKTRRRFTAGIWPLTVSITMTAAQVAILDEFFNVTTGGGSLNFDWVDPVTQQPVTLAFGDDPPALTAQSGVSFVYAISLEIQP